MCFGDLVVLTVAGVLLSISTVLARYFTSLVAIRVSGDDDERVIVEDYFEFFAIMEMMGVVRVVILVRVVGMIMVGIEASDGM